ncbi:MAG TPA: hypothetical protein VII78_03820 [Myxococcota bacterium]
MSSAAPRITEAVLAAGHDGRAELVVEVTYANGATARVRLDEEAAEPVLEAAGIARIEDLVGAPWDILAAALPDTER